MCKANPQQKTVIEFHKIRFHDGKRATGGLVLPSTMIKGKTVAQLSRYFPHSEATKMRTVQISEGFPTFEEAFEYSFDPSFWNN